MKIELDVIDSQFLGILTICLTLVFVATGVFKSCAETNKLENAKFKAESKNHK